MKNKQCHEDMYVHLTWVFPPPSAATAAATAPPKKHHHSHNTSGLSERVK